MIEFVNKALAECATHAKNLGDNTGVQKQIVQAGSLLAQTFKNNNKVISCGNGGSMSDAMHFAEELTGRFRDNRAALPALAISDPGHLTCVSNDFGYEFVFSRFLQAHGRSGDVLLAISTSGNSPNIISAAKAAKHLGMQCIGLTGFQDCALAPHTDKLIVTPGGRSADRIQELHIQVIHILIELVERQLFPENYKGEND